ncbi:hypothetical protein glysoja_040783 [Glycine soja]|uniref:Uncharacterized protein n=1 Tax=Glycine soja TaxID=3848 RepID=A0A0B2NXS1_GLYSO|nr:hypothetical protein glysoja_040783 [Glycine soja]
MSCTLWESLALEFKDCFNRHVSDPMVLLLTPTKIKEARGTYPIAIQNSMYGSQIFVNSDMRICGIQGLIGHFIHDTSIYVVI